MQTLPGSTSNVGLPALVRYLPRNSSSTVEIEGTIIEEFQAGFLLKDASGTVHQINLNYGKIEKVFVQPRHLSPNSVQVSPESVVQNIKETKIPSAQLVKEKEAELSSITRADQQQREMLQKGSTLLSFKSPEQKRIFFEASDKIRNQEIVVAPTKELSVQRNIEINRKLGREPQYIDSNGIPIYAPGSSYFRAMIVKPGEDFKAIKILHEDGWKSGYSRGVKIDDKDLGKPGFGATRLSDKAPVGDHVVEYVGPKVDLGGAYKKGFAFPRDSRIVGTASSSAVIDVAIKTAGELPKGSYLMITETVPRNKNLVNSKKLLEGREIEPKFPLQYSDGGVEHAVEGVEPDEIVNVIFIPINK